jgi:NADPH:quinone reductase-like Zn-dependent oxidoreductase
MRALAIADAFGIENLAWVERNSPTPGPGEVLVRMRAVAFNFRDIQVISGQRQVPRPLVPLSDACAEVVALGAEVDRFAVGDRVMPVFVQGWHFGPQPRADSLPTLGGPLQGTLCEEAVFAAADLVAVPETLGDAEAATLPCAAVSAWNALFVATQVKPGDAVLIQGTGGVSLFALQFARLAGCRTVVISSSAEKLARAAELGADVGIDYVREPDWGRAVRDRVGEVDCVVEVGGTRTFAQSLHCLRNGGHISFVGFLSGTTPDFDLGEISRKGISVRGIRVGNRDSFEAMVRAVAQHRLRPVVDHIGAFAGAKAELAAFRDGGHFGKVCLTFQSERDDAT